MKTKLLFCCLICCYFLSAQENIILYGLEQNYTTPSAIDPFGQIESMDLVSINPINGEKTTLFEIENAKTVAAGSSTFDAVSNQYFFWGFDDTFEERIYSLDLTQNTTIRNPVTLDNHVEMEYNYSNGKVYSLQLSETTGGGPFGGGTSDIDLVELDLNTGISTLISELPGIEGTGIGNSTFDPMNNLYIALGVSGGDYRIFGVNVLTGEMVYNSPLNQNIGLLLAFEYDWTNERLLGIRQTSDASNPFDIIIDNYLVEIDLSTGNATDLFTQPIFSGTGVAVGGVGFDQASQTYITYVGGDYDIGMFNTNTGELFNTVTMGKPFYELQVDNLPYATSFLSIPTSVKNNIIVEELVISPNPVSNELRIDLGDNFQQGDILEIYDITGKQIRSDNINTKEITLTVEGLATGAYFIKIRQVGKLLSGKFLKL